VTTQISFSAAGFHHPPATSSAAHASVPPHTHLRESRFSGGNAGTCWYPARMAREKYRSEELIPVLQDPNLWVHWVDANGELHHTPKSLLAIIPSDATFVN
jgi:hypothetical protein